MTSRAEELRIDGLVNVRDLGGLRTRDGRTIRSRQVIRQLAKHNPGTRTLVMGCYATRDPSAVATLPSSPENAPLRDATTRVRAWVDTGASIVALTWEDAERRKYLKGLELTVDAYVSVFRPATPLSACV